MEKPEKPRLVVRRADPDDWPSILAMCEAHAAAAGVTGVNFPNITEADWFVAEVRHKLVSALALKDGVLNCQIIMPWNPGRLEAIGSVELIKMLNEVADELHKVVWFVTAKAGPVTAHEAFKKFGFEMTADEPYPPEPGKYCIFARVPR